MQNAGLDEVQAGIKIAGRNINNFGYAYDTTLMAESKKKKVGLKLNIQQTKIMASGPITSWQIRWGKNGNSNRLYFFGLQNHCKW